MMLADFALAHETKWPRDIGAHLLAGAFEPAPWNDVLGPTAPRGGPNGVLMHRGELERDPSDLSRRKVFPDAVQL